MSRPRLVLVRGAAYLLGDSAWVFGPIPWNLNTAAPDFTPGTSNFSVGSLQFYGPDAFTMGITQGTVTIQEVPEPATGTLLGIAGLGLFFAGRRNHSGIVRRSGIAGRPSRLAKSQLN